MRVWVQPKTSEMPQAPASEATSAATRPAPSMVTPRRTLEATAPRKGRRASDICPTVSMAAPGWVGPMVAAKTRTITIMMLWVSTAPTAVSRRSERMSAGVSPLSTTAPCW